MSHRRVSSASQVRLTVSKLRGVHSSGGAGCPSQPLPNGGEVVPHSLATGLWIMADNAVGDEVVGVTGGRHRIGWWKHQPSEIEGVPKDVDQFAGELIAHVRVQQSVELAVRSGGVLRVVHPGCQGVQGPSGLGADAAGDFGDQ